jgi:hypothetical protein
MSEHVWFGENVEVYVAGGLMGGEQSRFEAHRAACTECAATLERARAADASMRALFAEAAPSVGFEDRVIQAVRAPAPARFWQWPADRLGRSVLAAAAMLILAGVGVVITAIQSNGRLQGMGGAAPAPAPRAIAAAPDLALEAYNETITKSPVEGAFPPAGASGGGGGREGRNVSGRLDVNAAESKGDPASPSEMAGRYGVSLSGTTNWVDADRAKDQPPTLQLRTSGEWDMNWVSQSLHVVDRTTTLNNMDPTEGRRMPTYSYRNDAPANKPATEVPRFKPLDLPVVVSTFEAPDDKKAPDPAEAEKIRGLRVSTGGQPRPPKEGLERAKEAVDAKLQEAPQPPQPPENPLQRKIIRNGSVEFEVDSFDSALMQITKIVAEEGGFVATTNSEKLPNGRVRGSVVVRVPPDRLDILVLKLRALGDLKNQRISSEDITKRYTDLESQLRAARAMEERLLKIIKDGKGEIKDLLEAEKQLGVWREKIETLEGEIRYYNNLVSLSTLTITLAEKDVRTPTSASETQVVDMGVEADDVEKAYADALAAIAEFKGRVTQSDLKQLEAGQFAATIACEVKVEQSGTLRDRIKQIGRLARLSIEHRQVTAGGVGAPAGIPIERKDTQFKISLYNLANVAPRQTFNVRLAAPDVEQAFRAILERVRAASARVLSSNLDRPQPDRTTGTIRFEVKRDDADALLAAVGGAGETMQLTVAENPDAQNVTEAKRGFVVEIFAIAQVAPRETATLALAARDVAASFGAILEAIGAAKGRVLVSKLEERDAANVTGQLDFEVMAPERAKVEEAIARQGEILSRTADRATDTANTLEKKSRMQIALLQADRIPPRETTTLAIEVEDVDATLAQIAPIGKTVEGPHIVRRPSGEVVGKVTIEVPLDRSAEALTKLRRIVGTVRVEEQTPNPKAPSGKLARARFQVTVGSVKGIVGADRGFGATLRNGLSTSVTGLLWSLNLIVIGFLFVGPWALLFYGGWRLYRRLRKKPAAA